MTQSGETPSKGSAEGRTLVGRGRALLVKVPVPSLILGVLGWACAALFLMLWLFDVGHGPLDSDRIGTAGEWAGGLGTTAAVGLSLHVLIRDRHERHLDEARERRQREIAEVFGTLPTEIELTKEARTLVPVQGRWKLAQAPAPGETPPERQPYIVEFEIFNGLDRPLNDLTVRMNLTGDWSLEDYDVKPWPGYVPIAKSLILPPGQTFRFGTPEEPRTVELSTERVEHAYITARWTIGDHEYSWSYHGSNEKTYLTVKTTKPKVPAAAERSESEEEAE